MSDNTVSALALVCIFGAPVFGYIVVRVLAHRERIEMIRRGMVPPQMYGGKRAKHADWGPPPMGGLPPQSVYVPPVFVPASDDNESADRSLRKGIMLAVVGLAILIGLSFIGYDTDGPFHSPEIHPGPWLLGGLIPMFVGVAQIIVALLSGARLGQPSRMPPTPRPVPGVPPPYAGTAGPPPYEPEPRAHSGYDELRRPAPPPDRL